MQHCDSTCSHCFREFVAWRKARVRAQDATSGRSGLGNFNRAAATSVRPPVPDPAPGATMAVTDAVTL